MSFIINYFFPTTTIETQAHLALGSKHYQPVINKQPRLEKPTQDMRASHMAQLLTENKLNPELPLLTTDELEPTCCEWLSLTSYEWFRWCWPTTKIDVENYYQQSIQQALDQSTTLTKFIKKALPLLRQQFPELQNKIEAYSELITRTLRLSQDFMQKMAIHPACQDFTNKDTYRALTNFWAYILFAYCCGKEIEIIEDDIFAVSLLYPLSDNLMDDKDLDNDIKSKIAKTITKALNSNLLSQQEGLWNGDNEISQPLKMKLNHIIDLIHQVRLAHQQEQNPCGAFASLQVIHQLQIQSSQMQSNSSASLEDIIRVTAMKGAGSVMIDAYLAQHQLTEPQQQLAVLMGSLAQWLNDIEGIEEDKQANINTAARYYFERDGDINYFIRGLLFIVERAKTQLPDDPINGINKAHTLMTIELFILKLLASAFHIKVNNKPIISNTLKLLIENYTGLPAEIIAALKTVEIQIFQQGTLSEAKQMKEFNAFIKKTFSSLNIKSKTD